MNAALPMSLFAFGLNHESAPLDVRERVAFPAERVNDALRSIDSAWASNCMASSVIAS